MTTMEMVQRKMAKLVEETPAGAQLRNASRRADVLRTAGDEVGRSGYWLVTDMGAKGFGRDRKEAEAALGHERMIEAVVEYLARQARRSHPDGEFERLPLLPGRRGAAGMLRGDTQPLQGVALHVHDSLPLGRARGEAPRGGRAGGSQGGSGGRRRRTAR